MKISARNILPCTVSRVIKGAVNSEIDLDLPDGNQIVAIITNTSAGSLELAPGKPAFAIVKANEVMIGTRLESSALSARNMLSGTITRVDAGAVNSEVGIALAAGSEVTASITKASVERLGLKVGDKAFVVIKASNVILGV